MSRPAVLRDWEDQGVLVVSPKGDLDIQQSTLLRQAVAKCLAEQPAVIVVDLADTQLDRSSVATLTALARLAAESVNTSFSLCAASPEATRLLQSSGVTRNATIWQTLEEAVEHAREPGPRRRIRRLLASSPEAPALARFDVVTACRRWSVPPEATAAAATVISELVTNAVLHAGGDVRVTLELAGDVLIVAVRDTSPVRPRPRSSVPGRESGRGLVIVSELSRSWGSLPTSDGGKVVWARISTRDRPRSATRSATQSMTRSATRSATRSPDTAPGGPR